MDHQSVTEDSDTSTSGIELTKTSRVDMSCIVADSEEDGSDVLLTPALMYPQQGGEFSEGELEYGTDLAGDLLAENRQYQLY